MTFAVIIQARMGSTRLPGKVMEPLGAKTALARCIARCKDIPGVDIVVCAVPRGPGDNLVADEAAFAGAYVVRGHETDVLARYANAARAAQADIVMRVTSDCPFIDPQLCGEVRDLLEREGTDYACNNLPPRFPHGVDCDVFLAEHLHAADALATDPYDREHVTPWLRRNEHLKRVGLVGPANGVERLRWTLDYHEDLAFFRAVFDAVGEEAGEWSWRRLAQFCEENPEIATVNQRRVDDVRLAAPTPTEDVQLVDAA